MENMTIYCKDFDLTESIKSYAEEKMSALNKFLVGSYSDINFNLRLGKVSNGHNIENNYYAEVSIHTAQKNFGGRVEAEESYAALDLLKDELAENIAQYNDKVRTLERRDAQQFKQQLHSID